MPPLHADTTCGNILPCLKRLMPEKLAFVAQRDREQALAKKPVFLGGGDMAFFVAFIAIVSSANAEELTPFLPVIPFMGLCT